MKATFNHELWHECEKCGSEFDLRITCICPCCGETIKIESIKPKE